jgi:7-carboxy-7-deazaguanine synthase
MLKINEIYQSIQGESSFTGIPCVFVRLTGCNLRCTYCDTEYAFYEGNSMTVREALSAVRAFGLKHVEITGGEPLMQKDVFGLMEELLKEGYRVLLETGGSLSIKKVPGGAQSLRQHRPAQAGGRGQVRHPRPRRLRVEPEHGENPCPRREGGDAVFSGARQAASQGPGELDSRGQAAG